MDVVSIISIRDSEFSFDTLIDGDDTERDRLIPNHNLHICSIFLNHWADGQLKNDQALSLAKKIYFEGLKNKPTTKATVTLSWKDGLSSISSQDVKYNQSSPKSTKRKSSDSLADLDKQNVNKTVGITKRRETALIEHPEEPLHMDKAEREYSPPASGITDYKSSTEKLGGQRLATSTTNHAATIPLQLGSSSNTARPSPNQPKCLSSLGENRRESSRPESLTKHKSSTKRELSERSHRSSSDSREHKKRLLQDSHRSHSDEKRRTSEDRLKSNHSYKSKSTGQPSPTNHQPHSELGSSDSRANKRLSRDSRRYQSDKKRRISDDKSKSKYSSKSNDSRSGYRKRLSDDGSKSKYQPKRLETVKKEQRSSSKQKTIPEAIIRTAREMNDATHSNLLNSIVTLTSGKPSTEKLSSEKLSSEQPSLGKPSSEKSSPRSPSSEKLSSDKLSSDKLSSEKPSSEKPSSEMSSPGMLSSEKPSPEKPSLGKPSSKESTLTEVNIFEMEQATNTDETSLRNFKIPKINQSKAKSPKESNGSSQAKSSNEKQINPSNGALEESASKENKSMESTLKEGSVKVSTVTSSATSKEHIHSKNQDGNVKIYPTSINKNGNGKSSTGSSTTESHYQRSEHQDNFDSAPQNDTLAFEKPENVDVPELDDCIVPEMNPKVRLIPLKINMLVRDGKKFTTKKQIPPPKRDFQLTTKTSDVSTGDVAVEKLLSEAKVNCTIQLKVDSSQQTEVLTKNFGVQKDDDEMMKLVKEYKQRISLLEANEQELEDRIKILTRGNDTHKQQIEEQQRKIEERDKVVKERILWVNTRNEQIAVLTSKLSELQLKEQDSQREHLSQMKELINTNTKLQQQLVENDKERSREIAELESKLFELQLIELDSNKKIAEYESQLSELQLKEHDSQREHLSKMEELINKNTKLEQQLHENSMEKDSLKESADKLSGMLSNMKKLCDETHVMKPEPKKRGPQPKPKKNATDKSHSLTVTNQPAATRERLLSDNVTSYPSGSATSHLTGHTNFNPTAIAPFKSTASNGAPSSTLSVSSMPICSYSDRLTYVPAPSVAAINGPNVSYIVPITTSHPLMLPGYNPTVTTQSNSSAINQFKETGNNITRQPVPHQSLPSQPMRQMTMMNPCFYSYSTNQQSQLINGQTSTFVPAQNNYGLNINVQHPEILQPSQQLIAQQFYRSSSTCVQQNRNVEVNSILLTSGL